MRDTVLMDSSRAVEENILCPHLASAQAFIQIYMLIPHTLVQYKLTLMC